MTPDCAPPPEGLVTELAAGRVRWDLLGTFPHEEPAERAAGDEAVRKIAALLDSLLDGHDIEERRQLPTDLFPAAHKAGFLRLQVAPADGGLGLSDHAAFRVIVAAMERSTAAGFALAVHNGIGLPALLPVVPAGPLRELIVDRLAQGAVSGWADTEPAGAGNTFPTTVAEPQADGGFRLTGEKVFIGNGTIADELIVSAAVPRHADAPHACLFLVDTRSDGFRVRSAQEVIGLKGLPLGALSLDAVEVPAHRVVIGPGEHWRDAGRGLLEAVSSRGRTFLISGAALAIARRCVEMQRGFARRRTIDGTQLTQFPVVRRLAARSLADLYALETVTSWALLGPSALTGRHRDRVAAKNITAAACWRIADRTVSLLAAEGAETAPSKRRRSASAHPEPLEQLFRDARVLRIAGGADFAVDLWSGEALVARASRDPHHAADLDDNRTPYDARLTSPNAEHLAYVAAHCRRLAHAVSTLARIQDDKGSRHANQCALVAVGGIAADLLAMTLTLARAAESGTPQTGTGTGHEQQLADIFCQDARDRLAPMWSDLENGGEKPPHRDVSDWWFASDQPALCNQAPYLLA